MSNELKPASWDIEELMRLTVSAGASDLHLAPGQTPLVRLHGELIPLDGKPALLPEDTSFLAKQLMQNGQWERFCERRELDISSSRPGLGRFRVNFYWQRGSVAIAMRTIPHEIPNFTELSLPPTMKHFAEADHGLFLVTGPTGSGKSTTLAAMLDYVNANRSCHIVTIEDPIEYLHRHKKSLVNQREMHQDTLSFQEALRHVLRQDPDVILIGEMRDLETIQTALTLAETGHLVLATLHTGDATQAITRIVDVYPSHQQIQAQTQLSMVLVGIVVQQLIRRKDCKGRVLAYEVLSATPAIRNLIRSGEMQQVYTAIQTGSADGMCTLNSTLLRLVRGGVISREDAMHKSCRQKELLERLHDR
jgi:twitching motility protein PilT